MVADNSKLSSILEREGCSIHVETAIGKFDFVRSACSQHEQVPLKNPLAVLVGQAGLLADGGRVNMVRICTDRRRSLLDERSDILIEVAIHPLPIVNPLSAE